MSAGAERPGPAPGRRLMIREMVLENFKSYAGRQQVGPFHKCFSSVVGPNGSGKSNVIDAMLFVFGRRAKQLRLNKVSELIHNSSKHRNLDTAKVSVHFQEIVDTGDEAFEVVPGSEFVVARTAHRNNTSNYYINERRSAVGEVTELLKGKGIDLDNNRFLILQGEVEQISMMKPKAETPHETGLLEYLEDIIGTDKYVEHIKAGAQQLEEMNERRQGMVQRLKLVERERDALEGARAAAEAYVAKERECVQTQCLIYEMHVRDGERNMGVIEKSLGELRGKLEYEAGKRQAFAGDLQAAEARYSEGKAAQAGVQAEADAAASQLKEFERRDIKLREDIKHRKAQLKKLGEKLAKDAARAEENRRKAEAAEAAGPRLQEEAARLAEQLQGAEQELERLQEGIKGEVEGHQKALQKAKAELAPWERQMAEVRSRADTAEAEAKLLTQQQAEAEARLQAAVEGAREAREAAKQRQAAIQEMRGSVGRHRQEAADARAQAQAAAAEAEKLEAGLRESRARLEQRRGAATAQRSAGAVVSALMEAKALGTIKGIHGRLGDLGAIDAKYDVAVSSACGALDHIVVEDAAAAQRCVELVRRRGLGVVTCLMLDRQRHLAHRAAERVRPPEGVPRLYDLIKPRSSELRPAFFHALGNTLVAADLEQASRIAYGGDRKWARVVTLQGEVINEAGTMSGGGGKPRGGRMRVGGAAAAAGAATAAEAAAELAEAEQGFNACKQAVDAARAQAEAATAAAAAAEKALAALEVRIPKAEMEVTAQQQRAADLEQRLEQLTAATQVGAADAQRLAELQAAAAAAGEELAQLEQSAAGPRGKAAAAQAKIDAAGGEPLQRARAAVAQLQQGIEKAEEEGAKRRVEAQAARKQAEKLSKEAAKTQAEQAKAEAELEQLSAEFKELEDAAFKVSEAQARTAAVLAEKAAALAAVAAEYEAKKKEVDIIRGVELELENKMQDLGSSLEFEQKAAASNAKRAAETRRKLQRMDGSAEPPAPTSEEQMAAHKISDLEFRVTMLEEELGRMSPDLGAIEAYRAKEADYGAKAGQLEAATAERDEVRRAHEELRKRRLDEFMAGFATISLKLKEMYQMITLGGDAELELVDSLDPFAEGVVFSVRPPRKSWKNISNLSGGEKTLSSLSLVFALHHFKPTPLYVMDEIDAALDFKNVSIVAHYIKERTKDAQFVIISLRNNMFELADRLVGIYKTDNATKSVAINPGEFAVGPAAAQATAPPSFQIALSSA